MKRNAKVTKKFRKSVIVLPVTAVATKYGVYSLKYFREAFYQVFKNLIDVNF